MRVFKRVRKPSLLAQHAEIGEPVLEIVEPMRPMRVGPSEPSTDVSRYYAAVGSCGGHGVCNNPATGACDCHAEYGGPDCGISCPEQCSGRGNCAAGGGCDCRGRSAGDRCETLQRDVVGCRATVGVGGECTDIKPCLAAMPTDCAEKTLELQPGVHGGAPNVGVGVASNESVTLIGVGGEGAAIIDGGGTDWLLSVEGNGSLALANLTLQRGFLPASSPMYGAALSVVGQGTVRATGVRFRDNEAAGAGGRGGAVSIVDSGADPVRWLDARFTRCEWEGNTAGLLGGGMYAEAACPSFIDCLWRNNTVGDAPSGFGGGLVLLGNSAAHRHQLVLKYRRVHFALSELGIMKVAFHVLL